MRTPIDRDLYCELKRKRTCERCKATLAIPLEIHHKVPVRRGGTNDRSNLMVVCRACHFALDAQLHETPLPKRVYEQRFVLEPDPEEEQ